MPSDSYTAIYKTIRDRLLSGADAGGDVEDIIGAGNLARLYQVGAPIGINVWPYSIMRIFGDLNNGPNQERTQFSVEVITYGRPRSQLATVRRLADLYDKVMIRYTDPNNGMMHVRNRLRDDLPFGVGEADAEVVGIRQLYSVFAWPTFLTSVTT